MKAVTAQQPGNAEVLNVVEIEQPQLADGEIKIKVKAFGLNKAESYYRSGNYGTFVPGQALGIEAVGEVVEDPSGQFVVGQKVATVMGGMMFARHGGYAEYICVNASNVVALDSQLSDAELASLPEVYLTVWGALDKNLSIQAGETLLIRGATSGLGMAALTYAKARGLSVIATTRNSESVARLRDLGADHVVIDNGDISEQVRALYPAGVDKCLEVVGAATVKDSMKAISPWGQVTVVGLLGGAPVIENFNLMGDLPNTIKLSFFSSGMLGTDAMPLNESPLNWVAQQIAAGTIPSIIASEFKVDDIVEAHQLLDSNKAGGKIVVSF
ncbi:zinc-binding dehydrogenase [Algibacillus agarilyticus]|uniref:zinc-binding dehydrogenase n=1 Tax=Algibacillus agarilyticus TaxID=2234133 RepID=UPI000DCFC4C7|nr:zinc-binding dehydrogenase [Algibacillus agarilyticus]